VQLKKEIKEYFDMSHLTQNETQFDSDDTLNKSSIINSVLPFASTFHCRKHDEISVDGSESGNIYFVKSGAIEVFYTLQNTKMVVALIDKGSFIGEIGFFDGGSEIKEIRAKEYSEICVFSQETLAKIKASNPKLFGDLIYYLAQSVCKKFQTLLEEREPLQSYAESLSTGYRTYNTPKPLPKNFFQTREWTSIHVMVRDFKQQMNTLSKELDAIKSHRVNNRLIKKGHKILNYFFYGLKQFKKRIDKTSIESFMWHYIFKEIYPVIMKSRFADRAYSKPKGYAGDFMMMEMLYQKTPDGEGKLGIVIDNWCLNTPSAQAVRNRKKLLSGKIQSICDQKKNTQEGPIHIMNLACGPNRELFEFLYQCDYSERIDATCVDIDSQALHYIDQQINIFSHKAEIRLMNENLIKWSIGKIDPDFGFHDIIYSAGLTDYLNDDLFTAFVNRCYLQLKDNGYLIIGNFAPTNPDRLFMDHILDWRLIYRTADELKQLFQQTAFCDNVTVFSEPQKVNLFVQGIKKV
jgi:CRP-like cAMP-binding protein